MKNAMSTIFRRSAFIAALLICVGLSAVPASAQLRRYRWVPQNNCGPCQGVQQGCGCPSCQNCGPTVMPGQGMPGEAYPGQVQPGDSVNPNAGSDPNSPSNNVNPGANQANQGTANQFAMSDQFAGGESAGARDMTIGDFFNNTGRFVGPSYEFMGNPILVNSPIAGGDRRYKVSDQFSPLPLNRVYFNYHNFDDPVVDINGNVLDVHRYTMGLERTFWQDAASFEVRVPFVHGLNRTQLQDQTTGNLVDGTEFGNVSVVTKFLMQERPGFAWSVGLATTIPTAEDAEVFTAGSVNPAVRIENEAIYLHPFIAWNIKPNMDTWMTLTTQMDFNVEGNSFISQPGTPGETADKFNDQNLLGFDISLGRWIYRDRCNRGRFIQGIAGIWELHYTTTVNDADIVTAGTAGDVFTNPANRTDLLNTTAGLRFQLGSNTFVTVAGVAPLRELEDRPFDAEFNLNFTRTY